MSSTNQNDKFFQKYMKYKSKYLQLKTILGGDCLHLEPLSAVVKCKIEERKKYIKEHTIEIINELESKLVKNEPITDFLTYFGALEAAYKNVKTKNAKDYAKLASDLFEKVKGKVDISYIKAIIPTLFKFHHEVLQTRIPNSTLWTYKK